MKRTFLLLTALSLSTLSWSQDFNFYIGSGMGLNLNKNARDLLRDSLDLPKSSNVAFNFKAEAIMDRRVSFSGNILINNYYFENKTLHYNNFHYLLGFGIGYYFIRKERFRMQSNLIFGVSFIRQALDFNNSVTQIFTSSGMNEPNYLIVKSPISFNMSQNVIMEFVLKPKVGLFVSGTFAYVEKKGLAQLGNARLLNNFAAVNAGIVLYR